MKYKNIFLASGTGDINLQWKISVRVNRKGRIIHDVSISQRKATSRIREYTKKDQIRHRDKYFFDKLGVDRTGLELHHDWHNGGVCFLLTHEEHKIANR